MKANKKSINNYYKGYERFKFQYKEYITNGFSILKLETDLEKSDELTEKLLNFVDNFKNNFKKIDSLDAKKIKEYFKENSFYKINETFSISYKEFNKAYNLKCFDKVNVKKNDDDFNYYNIIFELVKNDEVIGYLLPCKSY